MSMVLPANFAQVTQILYRGGQPENAVQGEYLARIYGIRLVVDLEWESGDAGLWPVNTAFNRICDAEPLPLFVPSLAETHVVEALRAIRRGPGNAYVHCRSGQNRTGVVIAAYRLVYLDQTIESVLTDFKSFRGWWAWADEGFIRKLSTRRTIIRRIVENLT